MLKVPPLAADEVGLYAVGSIVFVSLEVVSMFGVMSLFNEVQHPSVASEVELEDTIDERCRFWRMFGGVERDETPNFLVESVCLYRFCFAPFRF